MIYINDYASISAIGSSKKTICQSLTHSSINYLTKRDDLLSSKEGSSYFGIVKSPLVNLDDYPNHNFRNNQLLATCFKEISATYSYFKEKYDPSRIAIILGTSTAGVVQIDELNEKARDTSLTSEYFSNCIQLGDISKFLSTYLQTKGPSYTISTACSSSARALISAKRMLESDLVDVVIAGGVDAISKVPINGFDSMEVISSDHCNPFVSNRHGINIGEGCGLMILSKEHSSLVLSGCGESSDAHHISAPDPTGLGAISAINMALDNAYLKPSDIGYINMHGTGTKLNDAMESTAIASIFSNTTPCSSTKNLTGHTLGAAGIIEATFLCNILESNLDLPIQDFGSDCFDETLDDCGIIKDKLKYTSPYLMSNSFAFGGNNTSIIIGKAND